MNLFPVKVKINPKNYNELKALIDNIPLPDLITIIVGHGISLFAGVFVSTCFLSDVDGYNLKFSNDSTSTLVHDC